MEFIKSKAFLTTLIVSILVVEFYPSLKAKVFGK